MTVTKSVVVIGGGGHARVVIDSLLSAGAEVLGFVDKDPKVSRLVLLGVPGLGDDSALDAYDPGQIHLAFGIGCVQPTPLRLQIFQYWKARGFTFTRLFHRSAIVALDAQIGEGVVVMAGSIIQPGTSVGANAIINTGASLDHDCDIGDQVHIAPGAVLSGNVVVGSGAFIGAGAIVIQGIRIGAHTMVTAGSTVTRDLPPNVVARGTPARLTN